MVDFFQKSAQGVADNFAHVAIETDFYQVLDLFLLFWAQTNGRSFLKLGYHFRSL
jgi:hypothetical protein